MRAGLALVWLAGCGGRTGIGRVDASAGASLDDRADAAPDAQGKPLGHDFNGDGFADVIVGAPTEDRPLRGHVYVFFGGPRFDTVADVTIEGQDWDYLGGAIAAGDLNGDGYGDLVVGAAWPRRVYVYFGSAAPAAEPVADVVLRGDEEGFGVSVSVVGDVNGDGYGDLLVMDQVGGVHMFHGGPGVFDTRPDAVPEELARNVSLAAPAGDVNGDGYADLMFARPGESLVYFGGPDGMRPGGTLPFEDAHTA
jgi:VCBS repeat protein